MNARRNSRALRAAVTAGVLLTLWVPLLTARAQLDERAADPLGRSLRVGRVQVVHSARPAPPGSSMHLQQADPWLAYELGRSYFQREWTARDGLFRALTARPVAGAVTSCAMCHNTPFGSAGAGGNVTEPTGFGRNVPHLFGVGLLETLGIQIRQQLLARFDLNHNGFLDTPAETGGRRAVVEARPGVSVDFGALDDTDGNGLPDLNDVVKVTLVDRRGRPVPPRLDGSYPALGDRDVAGYDLAVGVLSSSIGDHHLPGTREFAIGVMQSVFGLVVEDNTVTNDTGVGRDRRADDGWAETSNAGAPQLYFPLQPPTGSGAFQHVSEGELDLLEWFLTNSPRPATGRQDGETRRGRRLLGSLECTACHVADWEIRPADPRAGFTGDRRFFDLDVSYDVAAGRLVGKLRRLTGTPATGGGETLVTPPGRGFTVRGVYTDFLHHDVGERFYEYSLRQNQLYALKRFRTPPLWGVGSTAPYGHDGRSPTLDDVIRRHSGDAEWSARLYAIAPARDREALLAFLRSLILYQPDLLPTDLDGDGRARPVYRRSGLAMGPERFLPELLFRTPPAYRGWVAGEGGGRYFSYALLNLPELYGRSLEYMKDADGNGVPDVAESRRPPGGPEGSRVP
jgi:hypothetical protein